MLSEAPTAHIWDVPLDAYHSDRTAISHSAKECFRRSQKLYHAVYVAGTMQPPDPSEAMQIGSLLHLAVLEPERFVNDVLVAPHVDRRTNAGKAQWASFQEHANGRQVIQADWHWLVCDMAAAIKASPVALWLLDRDGAREQSIQWTCFRTGLRLKSRRDFVAGDLIVDLKTCRDASPEAFAKSAANLGYARQAAHYLDGHEQLTGAEASFVFVAVENKPPHTVACYDLDGAAIELGNEQNLTTLLAMRDCANSGQWEAPHEKQINKLSLPKWAHYDDWSMSDGD